MERAPPLPASASGATANPPYPPAAASQAPSAPAPGSDPSLLGAGTLVAQPGVANGAAAGNTTGAAPAESKFSRWMKSASQVIAAADKFAKQKSGSATSGGASPQPGNVPPANSADPNLPQPSPQPVPPPPPPPSL